MCTSLLFGHKATTTEGDKYIKIFEELTKPVIIRLRNNKKKICYCKPHIFEYNMIHEMLKSLHTYS